MTETTKTTDHLLIDTTGESGADRDFIDALETASDSDKTRDVAILSAEVERGLTRDSREIAWPEKYTGTSAHSRSGPYGYAAISVSQVATNSDSAEEFPPAGPGSLTVESLIVVPQIGTIGVNEWRPNGWARRRRIERDFFTTPRQDPMPRWSGRPSTYEILSAPETTSYRRIRPNTRPAD